MCITESSLQLCDHVEDLIAAVMADGIVCMMMGTSTNVDRRVSRRSRSFSDAGVLHGGVVVD